MVLVNLESYAEIVGNLEGDLEVHQMDRWSVLKNHYLALPDSELSNQRRLVAILSLMTASSIKTAVHLVSDQTRLTDHGSHNLIMESVNAAPKDGLDDEELYKKGIIRGQDKYYLARPEHKKGAPIYNTKATFGKLRASMPDQYKKLLSVAIDCSYSTKNRFDVSSIQRRGLTYIALQLQPETEDKIALLEKLGSPVKAGDLAAHKLALKSSARAIRALAAHPEINVPVPEDLLDGISSGTTRVYNKGASLTGVHAQAASRTAVENHVESATAILSKKLTVLFNMGKISDQDRDVYLYMQTPRENKPLPSSMEAISFFQGSKASPKRKLTFDDIRTVTAKVHPLVTETPKPVPPQPTPAP